MRAFVTWFLVCAVSAALGFEHRALRAQSAELARLAAQVEALRERQEHAPVQAALPTFQQLLRIAPAATGAAAPAAAAPGASPAPAAPSARGAEPADAAAEAQERFLNDAVDRGWAAVAERGLSDRLGPLLGADGQVANVECRGTLCRVETVHPTPQAMQHFQGLAFLDAEPDRALWRGALQSEPPHPLADGRVVSVAYLSREE